MIHVHDIEQGTDEWKKLRRNLYTGTSAHKLLRFGAIEYARTKESNFKGNFYTKRGHILEDEAIDLYSTINDRRILRPGFITNDLYEGCGYSPDGIDGTLGHSGRDGLHGILLEVKCFNEKKHRSIATGDIPVEILAQIHFGMLITGLRQARLIIYNPDIDAEDALRIIEVKYNRNIQSHFKRILNDAKTLTNNKY